MKGVVISREARVLLPRWRTPAFNQEQAGSAGRCLVGR
jgi:hypothetical protein